MLGDAVANTSGVLELGNDQTIAGLQTAGTGTGNAVVGGTSTTATLTIDAGAGEPNGDTFDGVIGGSADGDNLALEVASGTLTLTGANSYSGATTVDEARRCKSVTGMRPVH